jgi:solute carrier family 25 protein 33/36
MQWVLYEEIRRRAAARARRMEEWGVARSPLEEALAPFADAIAGGGAKFVAALSTYPHEVVRTRLRQRPGADGRRKYTGLAQCFRLVVKEEGVAGLYGGLTAHMLRVVPNAAIMFGTYEAVMRLLGER